MIDYDYTDQLYELVLNLNPNLSNLHPIIEKKTGVIISVIKEKVPDASSILSYGVTPEVIGLIAEGYDVDILELAPAAGEFALKFAYSMGLDDVNLIVRDPSKKYDVILGLNQRITYEDSPVKHMREVSDSLLPNGIYLSTVRDFKNIGTKRFVDDVFSVVINKTRHYFMETREWDTTDPTLFTEVVFVTSYNEEHTSVIQLGPVQKKAMLFKNFARICKEEGLNSFEVHPRKLYKAMYSKSMQHIIVCGK